MALKRSHYTLPDTKDNSKDVPSELTDVEVFLKVNNAAERNTCNSEAPSSSPALTASWICSQ